MSDFEGKVVVITGAGGGLGKAHALEFAARGNPQDALGHEPTFAKMLRDAASRRAASKNNFVLAMGDFNVIDNGLGMTEEQLNTVFKLFHRNETKKHSTGIGLNIVKRLIEKLNGSITIDSTPNIGTTVYFKIEKIFRDLANNNLRI